LYLLGEERKTKWEKEKERVTDGLLYVCGLYYEGLPLAAVDRCTMAPTGKPHVCI
jgi:hypothetical protein